MSFYTMYTTNESFFWFSFCGANVLEYIGLVITKHNEICQRSFVIFPPHLLFFSNSCFTIKCSVWIEKISKMVINKTYNKIDYSFHLVITMGIFLLPSLSNVLCFTLKCWWFPSEMWHKLLLLQAWPIEYTNTT